MAVNSQLEELYIQDKRDRELYDIGKISLERLLELDKERLAILKKILPQLDTEEIWNCHYACLLLMHSHSKNDLEKAHQLAAKAVELGSTVTKWLYAASLDRMLISKGKKQKYGTQYDIASKKILPYDRNTTDEEREEYGVSPIKELLKR